jgi:hypothetical protein
MEKIKLLSVSKNEHRSEYIFPKEQKLFGIIREILYKLNFKDGSLESIKSFGRPISEDTEIFNANKEESIFNKNYKEKIINFFVEDYSLEIIFFNKKVALVFNYNKDKQQKISKVIGEFILEEQ